MNDIGQITDSLTIAEHIQQNLPTARKVYNWYRVRANQTLGEFKQARAELTDLRVWNPDTNFQSAKQVNNAMAVMKKDPVWEEAAKKEETLGIEKRKWRYL